VLDPDGKPVAGAKLFVLYYTPKVLPIPQRGTSDKDGRFRFTVARGEFDRTLSARPWDEAAVVALADRPNCRQHPGAHRDVRLAVVPADAAVLPRAEFVRVPRPRLITRQPFPRADVDLAQLRRRHDVETLRRRDRLRRHPGALEIARIDRVELEAAEPLGELARLLAAELRQRAVGEPLPAARAVPVAAQPRR